MNIFQERGYLLVLSEKYKITKFEHEQLSKRFDALEVVKYKDKG